MRKLEEIVGDKLSSATNPAAAAGSAHKEPSAPSRPLPTPARAENGAAIPALPAPKAAPASPHAAPASGGSHVNSTTHKKEYMRMVASLHQFTCSVSL